MIFLFDGLVFFLSLDAIHQLDETCKCINHATAKEKGISILPFSRANPLHLLSRQNVPDGYVLTDIGVSVCIMI